MVALPIALALLAVLSTEGSAGPPDGGTVVDRAGAPASGALAGTATPQREAEPVSALIRRAMVAYGGDRAQVRLGRVRAVGKLTSPLHAGEVGRYARVFSRSSRLRQEVEFAGSAPEVRILDG